MTNAQIKSAIISILIGAITIFLTQLLEGLLNFLQDWMASVGGGGVATITYFIRHFRG